MANIVVMPIARRAKAFQFRTWIDGETSLPDAGPSVADVDEAERVKPVRIVVDGLAGFQRRNVAFALRDRAAKLREMFGKDHVTSIVFDELAEGFER